MRLTIAIRGYVEDGPNMVALAVNAWADEEPAWWLNLQAPSRRGRGPQGPVRAQAAGGKERARRWAAWRTVGQRSGEALMADVDASAAPLSREVAIVVLEPRPVRGS
jgi:hypothetical protein